MLPMMAPTRVDPRLFIRLQPILGRVAEQYGLKFLGVIHQGNVRRLPPDWLATVVVVEDGSLFNMGMKQAPVPQKLVLWQMAVLKAKAMGIHFIALRLPTKWERFKVWGWRRLPRSEEKKKRTDRNPVPITMRYRVRPINPMEMVYGQPQPQAQPIADCRRGG